MIEIARVEPKKIQRKLLTSLQKMAICKKSCCVTCPLMLEISDRIFCYQTIMGIEQDIKKFWDEEIEIGVSE